MLRLLTPVANLRRVRVVLCGARSIARLCARLRPIASIVALLGFAPRLFRWGERPLSRRGSFRSG